ncbi:MAG TPA: hypothetical protein VF432_09860 [Thermoanaerobaculia bacterium]|jgi:hypothetical protein
MEDIRSYRNDDDKQWSLPDEEQTEWIAASDDEPPFHIPRD